MADRTVGSLCAAPWPIAVAALLAAGSGLGYSPAPGMKSSTAPAWLLADDTALVMGGTGIQVPNPSPAYIADVTTKYITPNFPEFTADQAQGLFTPENLYPLTGTKSLTLDQSLDQGVHILHDTIMQQVGEGNRLVVLGYSQSAVIAGLEMQKLAALPTEEQPRPDDLHFVLIGDPSNPNGGFFERLVGFTAPSIGATLTDATPSDTPYSTDIYTIQYDGYADFPKYPLNLLAVLNALMGVLYGHGMYPSLTPEQIADATQLATSPGYDGATTYYMIPTENLPLLEPLRSLPILGDPLADLIQPALKVIVDLGYDDPFATTTYADVPTPVGLFPNVDLLTVLNDLTRGAEQGFQQFESDLGSLSMPDPATLVAAAPPSMPSAPNDLVSELTHVVNTVTSVVATNYAALLPTADLLLTLLTSVPLYNFQLFMDGLDAGNLIDAIGNPLAADAALISMGLGLVGLNILNTATFTVDALTGLFT